MGMIRGKVVRLDGKLVVRYASNLDSEPKRYILYWPLSEDRSIGGVFRLEDREVVSDLGSEGWGIAPEDPDFWSLRSITAVLLNGGKTEAVKIEHEPIPCPKVRKGVETRYRYGHWEKLLKSGWVTL